METSAKNKLTDESTKIRSLEASAFNALRKNEDKINEKLNQITKLDQSIDFPDKYKEIIREALKTVGEALFEITRVDCPPDNDIEFYFWPGYDSYLNRDKKERILIIANNEESGIGFDGNGICYNFAPTKIGFDYLLDLRNRFLVKGKQYIPGSTHDWLSQEKTPVLRAENGDNEFTLKILEIRISEDYAAGVNPDSGKLAITLKEDDSENWGSIIGSFLNGAEGIGVENTRYKVCRERQWPLAEEDSSDKDVVMIREKLYSAWLATCFLSNWKELKWLNEFKESELELQDLKKRHSDFITEIGNGSKRIYSNSFYKHWYSIVLSENVALEDKSVGVRKNELGSIMLLTSYPIKDVLLYLIKYWIESIYLKLRSVEDQYFIKNKERVEATSKWAHALKTRIEFLKPLTMEVKEAGSKILLKPEELGIIHALNNQIQLMKPVASALKKECQEPNLLKNYIEILNLKIHELANLASAVHEITKENYNYHTIKKELDKYNCERVTTEHNHINRLLQESIKTALCRVVTDTVYMDYQRAREKIIADGYLTRQEGSRTSHDGERNLPHIFLEKDALQQFLFRSKVGPGVIEFNSENILEFFRFIYQRTKFDGIFTIDLKEFSNEEEEFFNFYLTLPDIQSTDIRFPFTAIVSLMIDEILLNSFKYYEKNDLGEVFIKIIINRPELPLIIDNIGKLMYLPVTISNTIDRNTIDTMNKSHKTSTGLNFVKMCLKLFSENIDDVFKVIEDRYIEYKFKLPVVFSRDMIKIIKIGGEYVSTPK